jgi:hypothetical protein
MAQRNSPHDPESVAAPGTIPTPGRPASSKSGGNHPTGSHPSALIPV